MPVAVLDTNRKPVAPCSEKRARLLLERNKAAVFRRFPFTIILKRQVLDPILPDLKIKIDPGSKVTGIAIVNQKSGHVLFAAEITHRGELITKSLTARRSVRNSRRARKTRYRQPRFLNRTRPKGWLPPSLQSRIANIETWTRRLSKAYPIAGIAMELVRFDMQLMENPKIHDVEYQKGVLLGLEVKEYLLIKFNHKCCYARSASPCSTILEVEHITPRSRGGSNRVSNLALACRRHNLEKGSKTAAEYGFPMVQLLAGKPLRDASAVNSARKALQARLAKFDLPLETGTGGQTKFNRISRNLPKAHWIDAACVGKSTPIPLIVDGVKPLNIKATGHGSRKMCITDKYGFPKTYRTNKKTFAGYRTGDIVKAVVPQGKLAGCHIGRITIRQFPKFILCGFDVHPKYIQKIHRADGYSYL